MMTQIKVKLSVAGVALVVAVGYLAYAGVRSAQVYYVEVDTFLAEQRYHDQDVRLCGTVAAESVKTPAEGSGADFDLSGRTGRVPVQFRGMVPDMFKPGCEVVVEGRLDAGGVFKARTLMTKCASKYKPEDYPQTGGPTTAPEERAGRAMMEAAK